MHNRFKLFVCTTALILTLVAHIDAAAESVEPTKDAGSDVREKLSIAGLDKFGVPTFRRTLCTAEERETIQLLFDDTVVPKEIVALVLAMAGKGYFTEIECDFEAKETDLNKVSMQGNRLRVANHYITLKSSLCALPDNIKVEVSCFEGDWPPTTYGPMLLKDYNLWQEGYSNSSYLNSDIILRGVITKNSLDADVIFQRKMLLYPEAGVILGGDDLKELKIMQWTNYGRRGLLSAVEDRERRLRNILGVATGRIELISLNGVVECSVNGDSKKVNVRDERN